MNLTLLQTISKDENSNTFSITESSRKLFQELEFNKEGLTSIKNSENLLKSLKKEHAFSSMDTLRASKYLVCTDETSVKTLEKLRVALQAQNENSLVEDNIPEAFKTSFTWTIDTKSLKKFIALKNEESTSLEMRNLVDKVFNILSQD